MTLYDIHNFFMEHESLWLVPILALFKLIDISKIPINPWRWLKEGIRRFLLGDLIQKVDKIQKDLDEHKEEAKQDKVEELRQTIRNAASDILQGKQFTKEQYEGLIGICDTYQNYCLQNNIVNGVIEESIAIIRNAYRIALQTNSFLKSEFYIPPKKEVTAV